MTERNPDTLPTPRDPSGPCPWCGRVSNFDPVTHVDLVVRESGFSGHRLADVQLSTLICHGCRKGTAVVTDQHRNGLHWWPAPGAGTLDRAVNSKVGSAYDEGVRCLAIGANGAAAVMFRSALSLFIKDRRGPKAQAERHLKNALKHMKADGSLHQSLWDWADHLNQLGNEGAHPEDYDDVTTDEAKSLGKFARYLIQLEYELPAQLLRARGLLNDETQVEASTDEDDGLQSQLRGGLDGDHV